MSVNTNIGTLSSAAGADSPLVQLNGIISNTKAALDGLVSEISVINTKSAVIRTGVAVETSAFIGALVYFDPSVSKYRRAFASVSSDRQTNGASVEGPESHVEGIIIDMDNTSYTATLLTNGTYTDNTVVTNCIGGVERAAGLYYLTPDSTNPGKAVPVADTYGKLQQGILSYQGGGTFTLNLLYLAHDNHYHGSAVLTAGNWTSVIPSGETAPSGYTLWYNPASDAAFRSAGQPNAAASSIFCAGILQRLNSAAATDKFGIYNGKVWYKGSTAPADSTVIFNHYGFAYGSPLVHTVASGSPSLVVDNLNGDVTISQSSYEEGTTANSATAITEIADGVVNRTTVVSAIAAGAGITADYGSDGVVTLSSNNLIGCPLDAYGIMHGGTTLTSDGSYQLLTFPAGRTASAIISMPVSAVSAAANMSACVWGCLYSAGSAAFTVKMSFVPLIAGAGTADLPTAASASVTTTLSFDGAPSGKVEYAYTTGVLPITGSGLLTAVITATRAASAGDARLLRIGFKTANTSVNPTSVVVAQEVEYAKSTFTAAEAITAGSALYMTSSGARICGANTAATANKCIGIALNSCAANESVQCAVSGSVTSDIFSYSTASIGLPLYVGGTGQLTTTNPTSAAYSQQVGTVIATNAILLSIRQAVVTPAE